MRNCVQCWLYIYICLVPVYCVINQLLPLIQVYNIQWTLSFITNYAYVWFFPLYFTRFSHLLFSFLNTCAVCAKSNERQTAACTSQAKVAVRKQTIMRDKKKTATNMLVIDKKHQMIAIHPRVSEWMKKEKREWNEGKRGK